MINNIYKAVKINYKNYSKIIKTDSLCGNNLNYRDGMISFRLVSVIDTGIGSLKNIKIINSDECEYFFGEYISIENLKYNNREGKYDELIYNMGISKGIGLVKSPEGVFTVLPKNGVIINTKMQNKQKYITRG